MKLKEGFVTREMGGEQIMVATGDVKFSGIVRSNATAAFIVNCLKKDTTKDGIVDAMAREYDADRNTLTDAVESVLTKLRSIDALDE